ncbi:Magnesium-protoporphyrin IX monomethyl ester [oxidative] cyclase [Trichinella spiralis]|uniref:Magnesium-protoporphyrin IX monomethyl ester [oxidative] cyclase n=1 Tax=Trichinella spiralis TaxID=6334 RepID=A0ABR3KXY7_TRISP
MSSTSFSCQDGLRVAFVCCPIHGCFQLKDKQRVKFYSSISSIIEANLQISSVDASMGNCPLLFVRFSKVLESSMAN